jgi:L-threonylcarbamoyladenylate synthase
MQTIRIDPDKPGTDAIKQAASVIRNGGIIVYPTDTLYGFGIDLNNQQAVNRLNQLKGRDVLKPISILINSRSQAEWLIGPLNPDELACFDKLLPGKITLVFPRRIPASLSVFKRFDKIGVRYPRSKVCDRLITELGFPISSTSVNLAGKPNLGNAGEIQRSFGDAIDLILDSGPSESLLGSTILDCSFYPPVILREGDVRREQIESILGITLKTAQKRFLILFVCSGNICRSPMAEGILRRVLSKTKYKDQVEVKSAGTLQIEDAPAAPEAIEAAYPYDIPLTRHRSRSLTREILAEADLVFCMALNHYNFIQTNFPEYKDKIFLLKQWHENRILSNPSIADPIGRDFEFFKKTFNQIYIEIMRILPEIFKLLKKFSG